jgi:hypothetical protein
MFYGDAGHPNHLPPGMVLRSKKDAPQTGAERRKKEWEK